MGQVYDIEDLERWDERIREKAQEFGLSGFPQDFELCDHHGMLAAMAYAGMPSHYPHWSYGKAYEKLKTLYDYGVTGLPYEMVINANPSLAYLMRDNSLLLQILTIAHVYGHNDFFKNNFTFQSTRPEHTISMFKAHAARIRAYIEDPSIGLEKIETWLDAAHALSLQCRRNLAIRKRSPQELQRVALEAARPKEDPFYAIHKRQEYTEPNLKKVPLEPDEDILLFIRDHNPFLEDWQKDVLTIVHEEAQYFIPQIETKIMNEGWASYWHKKILESLNLPQDLHLEFIVRHSQVVRPFPGGINPYHVGLRTWEDICRRYDDPTPEEAEELGLAHPTGAEKLFEAREVDRDISFLRRHLTERLVRELDLFEYKPKDEDLVISSVADKDGWKDIKETLLRNIGTNTIPMIKVHDADFGGNRTLYLVHEHDGRDLEMAYAEKTLAHVYILWGRGVVLETTVNSKKTHCTQNALGLSATTVK